MLTAVAVGPMVQAEDVEALFKKGSELRRKGRDADALVEFQRAARIKDSPRAEAQIGLAEQALGLWPDAQLHLSSALDHEDDRWVQKNRSALDGALATIRLHLGQAEIWGTPAGAQIVVDGKPAGALPRVNAWLAPGDVPLQVRAAGYEEATRILKIQQGARVREHIELRRAPASIARAAGTTTEESAAEREPVKPSKMNLAAAETTSEAPTPTPTPTLTLAGRADEPSARVDETEAPAHGKWWLWTLLGVGVIAAGGATAWVVTHRGTAAASCTPSPCSMW